MSTERNPIQELDYLSGALFAHEVFISAILQALRQQGIIAERNQRRLIAELLHSPPSDPAHPDFQIGYREALEKFQAFL